MTRQTSPRDEISLERLERFVRDHAGNTPGLRLQYISLKDLKSAIDADDAVQVENEQRANLSPIDRAMKNSRAEKDALILTEGLSAEKLAELAALLKFGAPQRGALKLHELTAAEMTHNHEPSYVAENFGRGLLRRCLQEFGFN